MKTEIEIQKQVDDTLNSIDGINRAVANPYLFTRIQAGLLKEQKGLLNRMAEFFSKPVITFSAIAIILVLNFLLFNNRNDTSPKTLSADNEQLLAKEYNFSNQGIYDLSSIEQNNETADAK